MNWTDAVDIYCERTDPSFWAEPLNAVSNAAFMLAALWGAVSAHQRGLIHPVLWGLILLAGLIGIGSFLFHTFATQWSALADVAPIWIFVALYILAAMYWLGGMRPGRIAAVVVGVVALGAILLAMTEGGSPPSQAPRDPGLLNGSQQYAPALLALIIFSVLTGLKQHPYRHWLWGATAAFIVSLTFRTVDVHLCNAFPIGTHFVWHLMNGAMIAALLQLMVRVIDDQARGRAVPG